MTTLRDKLKKIQREFFGRFKVGDTIPDADYEEYRRRMRAAVEEALN